MRTFTQYLKEISLSRVWQHVTDYTRPIGIMSAFTDGATFEENMAANARLAQEIRSAGYGYSFVDGHYTHDTGQEVDERSILIIGNPGDSGNLKGALKHWRAAYDQNSVLYKPARAETAVLIYANREESVGQFHPNRLGAYYTKMRGRPGTFVFEEAWTGKNWLERWGEDLLRARKPSENAS